MIMTRIKFQQLQLILPKQCWGSIPNQKPPATGPSVVPQAVDRQQEEAVAPKQRIADEDELMVRELRQTKEWGWKRRGKTW